MVISFHGGKLILFWSCALEAKILCEHKPMNQEFDSQLSSDAVLETSE